MKEKYDPNYTFWEGIANLLGWLIKCPICAKNHWVIFDKHGARDCCPNQRNNWGFGAHTKGTRGPFKCPVCGKEFSNAYHAFMHCPRPENAGLPKSEDFVPDNYLDAERFFARERKRAGLGSPLASYFPYTGCDSCNTYSAMKQHDHRH